MSTYDTLDYVSETIDDSEDMFLSAIPIIPEGMVDVALSELGAVLIDVFFVEKETPLFHAETD